MQGAKAATATFGLHLTFNTKSKTLMSLNRTKFYTRKTAPFRTLKCSSSAPKGFYQPFRRPPTVQNIPDAAKNLNVDEQLNILRDRIGLWHQYADIIPVLSRAGFTPPTIEEATGISGVEQNKIVVASRVRSSLISNGFDENSLAFFDKGGADILYEFRTLSAEQRISAARFAIENSFDGKEARDLARAMKDFEWRRKGGWDSFSPNPGDCLAFSFYCQSKEYRTQPERESALRKALSYAVTEKAKAKILESLNIPEEKDEDEALDMFRHLLVLRLKPGDVSEAKLPLVVPVINANSEEFSHSPTQKAMGEGPFRVYRSETAWSSWVVLPGWEPLIDAEALVVLYFPDANVLPWRVRNTEKNDPILVAVDKAKTEIETESFYLVNSGADNSLTLQRGSAISASAGSVLGMAVLVVRRPKENEEPEMIDWD